MLFILLFIYLLFIHSFYNIENHLSGYILVLLIAGEVPVICLSWKVNLPSRVFFTWLIFDLGLKNDQITVWI